MRLTSLPPALALAVTLVAFAALAAIAATGVPAGQATPNSNGERVVVAGGVLEGAVSEGIASYKGIPYAAPPVGDLRWRAPRPAPAWSGVREADDYGATCPQSELPRNLPAASRARTMSEDCLTLNVWTPVARSTALPVMVWLHGGGNVTGTGSSTYYDGTAFAHDGVVLVTLNYRLGALGFFAHRALIETGGDANFGLLDQLAALRWVRANVAAFGGDPGNVTLFGESAGGEDTVILTASDASRGLFRRAIAESAGDLWGPWPTLPQAETRSAGFATELGLPGDGATPAQLRALPAEKLAGLHYDEQLGPVVDGRTVVAALRETLANGARVPLLIGTNDDDGSVLGGFNDLNVLFWDIKPSALAAVRERYRKRGVPDAAVAARLLTDAHFAVPARWIAGRMAAAGVPAYLYRFDYVVSFLAARRTAASHGSEIPLVFATFPEPWLTPDDRRVEAALHGCWVAFARTGDPSCPSIPAWPRYDARDGRVMVFDANPSLRDPGDNDVLDLLAPSFEAR